MIATINGQISQRLGGSVIVECAGLGYEVFLSTADLVEANVGSAGRYWIYDHYREDAHVLYGFAQAEARDLFTQLLGVSGVGPKVALGVMSAAPIERLKQTIAAGDADLLKGVAGVGKKTAERVVIELRSKVGAAGSASSADPAYQALVGLGYSAADAAAAVGQLPSDLTDEQARIKAALKGLVKS